MKMAEHQIRYLPRSKSEWPIVGVALCKFFFQSFEYYLNARREDGQLALLE